MSPAVLTLAFLLLPARSVAALPDGEPNGSIAFDTRDGVQVTAWSAVPAIRVGTSVPISLTAVRSPAAPRDGHPTLPKRVSVMLCLDWQCSEHEVVQLAVAEEGETPVRVERRLATQGTFALRELGSDRAASGSISRGGGRSLVAVFGTGAGALPDGGWMSKAAYGRSQAAGGIMPVDVTDVLDRYPELVYGYNAVVVEADQPIGPVLRTTLSQYLRAGGTLMVPAALADSFRLKIGEGVEARAVLDGQAPLQTPPVPLFAPALPAFTTQTGQEIRPAAVGVALPVAATPIHSGLLLAYEPGATPVQLADALLLSHPNWNHAEYDFLRISSLDEPASSGAAVWLARVPPTGWMLLIVFLWGAVVVVVTRRAGRRRPWRSLAQLGAVSAVLVLVALVGGRVLRGEAKEVTVRITSVLDGASFGVEHGVRARSVPAEETLQLEAPRGTFAWAVQLNRAHHDVVTYRQLAPEKFEVSVTVDRPAGVAWSRPVPVSPTLRLGPQSGPKAGQVPVVTNPGKQTYDFVALFGDYGDRWASGPLLPGGELFPRNFRNRYEADAEAPLDLREAAARRMSHEIGAQCPHSETETGGRRRRCAVGFVVRDTGIDAVVVLPRDGPAYAVDELDVDAAAGDQAATGQAAQDDGPSSEGATGPQGADEGAAGSGGVKP